MPLTKDQPKIMENREGFSPADREFVRAFYRNRFWIQHIQAATRNTHLEVGDTDEDVMRGIENAWKLADAKD